MDTKIDSSRAIALPATDRFAKPLALIKGHAKLLAIGAVIIVVAALAYFWWGRKDSAGDYLTDKVTRGTVEVNVSATGTLQAVTTVLVGSQVSGAVAWLGADFKSQVQRGQVIAKLDPALFQAQIDNARANLQNAQAGVQAALTEIQNQKANVEAAKANDLANKAQLDDAVEIAKQNAKLKGVIPDREIEASQNQAKVAVARFSQATSQIGQAMAQLKISESKLKQAQAAVAQSTAQLEQANVNYQHSIITSPIDGVVVSRNVDVGQTVAASLSAPTLFTIANDLTNMQVLASIDEADVGQVREGIQTRFTVDAFPGQTFTGEITQVRLNAQTVQNVVTYQAVITVANPDQKLMPGMTANITIPVARRDNVLRIPNAALRFKPDLTDQQQKDVQAKIDAFRQQSQSQRNSDQEQPADKKPADGEKQQSPQQTQSPASSSGDGSQRKQKEKASASPAAEQDTGKQKQPTDASRQSKQSSATPGNKPEQKAQPSPAQGQSSDNQAGGSGRGNGGSRQRTIQVVWILTANKTLEPHVVRTGITDGRFTEVSGDLNEGDVVVIGQTGGSTSNKNSTPQTTTPFGQRPPAAGGGRGR